MIARLAACLSVFAVLVVPAASQPVTIVSFNVENLFDAEDDHANLGENSYLPLTLKNRRGPLHDIACKAFYHGFPTFLQQCKALDWNEEVYAAKIARIADVIGAMPTPDVIVLQEVENRRVLDDLVERHLKNDGYRVIQLDTSDKAFNRGIDVGILSRLQPAGAPTAHGVDFGSDRKSCGGAGRDILVAPLRLPDGETLRVYGVHFTPGVPRAHCRARAFRKLNALVNATTAGSLAVAAGDFNIGCHEAATDETTKLLEDGNWVAPPLFTQGCSVVGSWRNISLPPSDAEAWSWLDMILVSPGLNPALPSEKNWFADLGSFSSLIVHPDQIGTDIQNQGYIYPRWFDPQTGYGVSDHFPVSIRLMTRRN